MLEVARFLINDQDLKFMIFHPAHAQQKLLVSVKDFGGASRFKLCVPMNISVTKRLQYIVRTANVLLIILSTVEIWDLLLSRHGRTSNYKNESKTLCSMKILLVSASSVKRWSDLLRTVLRSFSPISCQPKYWYLYGTAHCLWESVSSSMHQIVCRYERLLAVGILQNFAPTDTIFTRYSYFPDYDARSHPSTLLGYGVLHNYLRVHLSLTDKRFGNVRITAF
jgi:hypothetical protein